MFQQIFVENRANSFLFSMASVVLKKITCCSFREGKRSQVAGVPVQRHLLAGVVVKHLSLVHRLHPGLRLRNPAPGLLPVCPVLYQLQNLLYTLAVFGQFLLVLFLGLLLRAWFQHSLNFPHPDPDFFK